MTAKTKQCDECEHWDETLAAYLLPPCGIGHKPRFYHAQLDKAGRIPGWKRRCEDFKEKSHDPR